MPQPKPTVRGHQRWVVFRRDTTAASLPCAVTTKASPELHRTSYHAATHAATHCATRRPKSTEHLVAWAHVCPSSWAAELTPRCAMVTTALMHRIVDPVPTACRRGAPVRDARPATTKIGRSAWDPATRSVTANDHKAPSTYPIAGCKTAAFLTAGMSPRPATTTSGRRR